MVREQEENEEKASRPRANLRQMVAVGLVAALIGIALGLLIDWFPIKAATASHKIDTLFYVLLSISVAIFVAVTVIVIYSVVVFRKRPGDELKDGPPIHGNTMLEVVWTALPAALVAALCVYAYVELTHIEAAKADTMNVRVVGEQFTWNFYYPDENGKEIRSPQLYLPANQHVHFTVQSKDVLHSFWVPQFRLKIDAVPGMDTKLRVTTTSRTGDYPVACAELCGLGHALMRQTAHVVSPAAFNAWLNKQRSGAQGKPGGAPSTVDGKAIFTSEASPPCSTCHTLKDAGASGTIGPDLDKMLKGKSKAFIRQSIVDPGAVVTPGYQGGIMPTTYGQSLSEAEINGLVDYLAKVTNG